MQLYPDFPCYGRESDFGIRTIERFEVEVHEIESPIIGLAAANCEHVIINADTGEICKAPTNVSNFLNSDEISLFNTFFPVSEHSKKFVKAEYRTMDAETEINKIIAGLNIGIDYQEVYEKKVALALQMSALAINKILGRYNYLVGIGSETFFTDPDIGLVL